jgi:medium-chain acyl-[acyl-carrier-protein] hydrolase
LFCLHHAGGAASAYFSWRPFLREKGIEMIAVQMPGRESRMLEPFLERLSQAVTQLAGEIEPYLNVPFSFFGHSMGALIAFDLARELQRRGLPRPAWVLISAARAPHRPRDIDPISNLPIEEFVRAVAQRYNAVPSEVLDNPELLDVIGPVLRADYKLFEEYSWSPDRPLDSKIAAFGGTEDSRVSPVDLEHWRDLTIRTEHFRTRTFEGGHFYLKQNRDTLVAELARILGERDASRP